MIQELREDFNRRFTQQKYAAFIRQIQHKSGGPIQFRPAETPVFLPPALLQEIIDKGASLTNQLLANADYMRQADAAIPEAWRMPAVDAHPHFMTADFGLVKDDDGRLRPKLVELQAFPSVFGYQAMLSAQYVESYDLDPSLQWFLGGMNATEYWDLLRSVIVGSHAVENVILAEVDPLSQKTLPDFHLHQEHLGIRTVDIASLRKVGRRLEYEREGVWTPVHRIYNRAIVDEIVRRQVQLHFDYRDDLDVEWAGHPDWYFRISKFSLPFLQDEAVPPSVFLDAWFQGEGRDRLPPNRANLILKPLYSYAGKGIEFAPTDALLQSIPQHERHAYLLQQRVHFEPVVDTPQGPTQAEIRILYVWPDHGTMTPTISLVRMGRGLMMGVDHNKNQEWVGGTAGIFPRVSI